MTFDEVKCITCRRKFMKDHRYANENKKLGHKFFCSPNCLSLDRNKQKEFICENPKCKKIFKRRPSDINLHNFCSKSCSAIFFNIQKYGVKTSKPPLTDAQRKKLRLQGSKLGGRNRWLNYQSKVTKEYVIKEIQKFVNRNGRNPVKREQWRIYKPARKYFGTWNNAVKEAGFDPNPVLFAKKQIANDGHICDSLAEKIIDDYLFEKGISHERNFPYPEGDYTRDFKIENKYIEYFGLAGELARYDELVEIKREIATRHKINLLEIYPKNLYRKNGLEEIFGR